MFVYEKKLQYPVRVKNCNPRLASVIISQYGGPNCNRLSLTEMLSHECLKICIRPDHKALTPQRDCFF